MRIKWSSYGITKYNIIFHNISSNANCRLYVSHPIIYEIKTPNIVYSINLTCIHCIYKFEPGREIGSFSCIVVMVTNKSYLERVTCGWKCSNQLVSFILYKKNEIFLAIKKKQFILYNTHNIQLQLQCWLLLCLAHHHKTH